MALPVYGLAMIVKNGEATLRACLESAKPHIGYWTISDTGSTDGTKAIIADVLGDIPGRLFDLPFLNFGHNRSEVFVAAHGMSQWILALDADMTVEIEDGFAPDPECDAAMIEMRDSGLSWRLPLVLRGDLPWKSIGPVHEYTALSNGKPYRGVPTDAIRVQFPPTQSSPSKRHWHAGLLEEELTRQPFDARSTFYLAQTYRELGDPRARDLYVKRSLMDSGPEAWYAAYRAALLTDWPARAAELMAAWERWPARLEPLYYLMRDLNEHGCHRAAYQLAIEPGEPPEALFVEPGCWDWGIAFERSVAAWYVGHRDEARQLSEALLANPRLPATVRAAVTRNLAFMPREEAA